MPSLCNDKADQVCFPMTCLYDLSLASVLTLLPTCRALHDAIVSYRPAIAFALTRVHLDINCGGTLRVWALAWELCAGAALAQDIPLELWANSYVATSVLGDNAGIFGPTADGIVSALEAGGGGVS